MPKNTKKSTKDNKSHPLSSESKKEDKVSEPKDKINPRWDVINELYDAIDTRMVVLGNKNEMNFIEISLALHMINQKIEYEQFKAMFDFNVEGLAQEKTQVHPADGMYR